MTSRAEQARSRVERLCGPATDARSLQLALLDEIRTVVGFDAYAWLLTDPATWVGVAPLAEVPCLPELPRLIRLKYLTTVNRWTTLDGSAVALLTTATAGDLDRSLLWRELVREYGVSDMASCVFADRFGCWGFLDLWRCGGTVFSVAEASFLASIAEPVTTALRRAQAATFAAPVAPRPRVGPVVLLLSPDLAVRAQTPQTRECLQALVPSAIGGSPIPASAYNVAAQLLALEAGVDPNQPSARVHVAHGGWLTLRAARISEESVGTGSAIAVTIEDTVPAERAELFARACGLSEREGQLLDHLITGCDTRELARRMHLSEHTVQDHLKSVFAKTSVRSRGALLARALGS